MQVISARSEVTLYSIYQAINESEQVHVLDLHQNPNDECIVGRHVFHRPYGCKPVPDHQIYERGYKPALLPDVIILRRDDPGINFSGRP